MLKTVDCQRVPAASAGAGPQDGAPASAFRLPQCVISPESRISRSISFLSLWSMIAQTIEMSIAAKRIASIVGKMIALARKGKPQCRQSYALSETAFLHSGQ